MYLIRAKIFCQREGSRSSFENSTLLCYPMRTFVRGSLYYYDLVPDLHAIISSHQEAGRIIASDKIPDYNTMSRFGTNQRSHVTFSFVCFFLIIICSIELALSFTVVSNKIATSNWIRSDESIGFLSQNPCFGARRQPFIVRSLIKNNKLESNGLVTHRLHHRLPHILVTWSNRNSDNEEENLNDPVIGNNMKDSIEEIGDNNKNWMWIVTLILPLWLVYISNQWSRYSISYLVDFSLDPTVTSFTAMNVDIGFNQVQYGLLASVAFTLLYAVASLVAGIAADKFDRKLLTVLSCSAWAVATLGTALSNSYGVVIIWRILMGLACAFATPTAYTLINKGVPPNRVALGTSIYGTGVAFGSGLSSLSIILDNSIGWRQTEILIAVLGFVAAILCAVILPSDNVSSRKVENSLLTSSSDSKLNIRGENTSEKQTNLSFAGTITDMKEAVSITRVQWIYLASFLRFCSGITIGVWSAPYFRMVFFDNQEQYSVVQAGISAILATVSGLLGGAAADYLSQQQIKLTTNKDMDTFEYDDPVGRRLWVPVIGSVLAAPTWYLAVNAGVGEASSFELSMFWLAVEYFVAECWFGPTISSLQTTVASRKIGGTAQGLFSLTGAAANSAPAILGYIYGQAVTASADSTAAGAASNSGEDLSTLLIGFVCVGYLSSAACFAMASLAGPPKDLHAINTKTQ